MSGLRVQARQCATCIYRPDSPLDLARLEKACADPRMAGHFAKSRTCHHSRDAVCAGFWQRHKDHFDAGQLAQRLRMVAFVHDDNFKEARMKPKNQHAVALGRRGGKIGGKVSSEAKAAAARENGRKGGRPKKLVAVALGFWMVATSAAAQSPLYTNADLGKQPVAEKPPVPSAAVLRGLQARQFVYVPTRPTLPTVATTGADAASGPFGPFPEPPPDRRLDGSLWTEPAWEMRAYVGHGYYGHGHYGGAQPRRDR